MDAPKDFMPPHPQEGYSKPELIDVIEDVIIERFDEIAALATAGLPPVAALIPDLSMLINESYYWRLADRCIGYALAPDFTRVGRVRVSLPLLRRGAIYEGAAVI